MFKGILRVCALSCSIAGVLNIQGSMFSWLWNQQSAAEHSINFFAEVAKPVIEKEGIDFGSITFQIMAAEHIVRYTNPLENSYTAFYYDVTTKTVYIHPKVIELSQDRKHVIALKAALSIKYNLTPERLEQIFTKTVQEALNDMNVRNKETYSIKPMTPEEETIALARTKTFDNVYVPCWISGKTISFLGGEKGARLATPMNTTFSAAHEVGHAHEEHNCGKTLLKDLMNLFKTKQEKLEELFEHEKAADARAVQWLCATKNKHIVEHQIQHLESCENKETKMLWPGVRIIDRVNWLKEMMQNCKECHYQNVEPASCDQEFVEIACKQGLEDGLRYYISYSTDKKYAEKLQKEFDACAACQAKQQ